MANKKKEKVTNMFEQILSHDMMTKSPEELPNFLKYAIEHERKCVKLRTMQIEEYLKRLQLMFAGMDYLDTFNNIKPIHPIPFNKDEYLILRGAYEKSTRQKADKYVKIALEQQVAEEKKSNSKKMGRKGTEKDKV